MQLSVLSALGLAAFGYAAAAFSPEQCGPTAGGQICPAGQSCSQYGWCGTTSAYTDRATCQPNYSANDTGCYYVNHVPNIDVCGVASNGISCPGAGSTGYFYRCCSSHGHCGPKNNIQDESLYCSVAEAGCQPGYGSCNTTVTAPKTTPNSSTKKNVANGQTCGPIANAQCGAGLCCSGSNYCGTGDSFCGSDNWCQPAWSGSPSLCVKDAS